MSEIPPANGFDAGREEVPFPNPQNPVPPPARFNAPVPPQVAPPPVSDASCVPSPHVDALTAAQIQGLRQQAAVNVAPGQVVSLREQVLPNLDLGGTPAAPSGPDDLLELLRRARAMPYDRLLTAAELVVELAKMIEADSVKVGKPITFPVALQTIHNISGMLAYQPGAIAQLANFFQ